MWLDSNFPYNRFRRLLFCESYKPYIWFYIYLNIKLREGVQIFNFSANVLKRRYGKIRSFFKIVISINSYAREKWAKKPYWLSPTEGGGPCRQVHLHKKKFRGPEGDCFSKAKTTAVKRNDILFKMLQNVEGMELRIAGRPFGIYN